MLARTVGHLRCPHSLRSWCTSCRRHLRDSSPFTQLWPDLHTGQWPHATCSIPSPARLYRGHLGGANCRPGHNRHHPRNRLPRQVILSHDTTVINCQPLDSASSHSVFKSRFYASSSQLITAATFLTKCLGLRNRHFTVISPSLSPASSLTPDASRLTQSSHVTPSCSLGLGRGVL